VNRSAKPASVIRLVFKVIATGAVKDLKLSFVGLNHFEASRQV
jgi:hypothetical protein